MKEWRVCPMYFIAMIILLVSIICSRVVESMEIRPECENWPFGKGYNAPLNPKVSENITKTEMPSGEGTRVKMKFTIKGPFSIDESDQTLKVSANMVISWLDERLALTSYPYCWLNKTDASACTGSLMHIGEPAVLKGQIWIPRIEMHNYVLKTEDFDLTVGLPPMIVDGCNGKVVLESSSQLTVSCSLHFHFYPFDQQACVLEFSALPDLGHVRPVLDWDGAPRWIKSSRSKDFDESFDRVAKFYTRTENCDDCKTNNLRLLFILTRTATSNIGRIFMPPTVMVAVSFLTFLIPPDQTPARVGMSVTIMLTVISQGITLHNTAPKVSYVMVAGMWQEMCFVCTFIVLAEYCIVIHFMKRKPFTRPSTVNVIVKPSNAIGTTLSGNNVALKIERYMRIILPSFFCTFFGGFVLYVAIYSRPEELAGRGHILRDVEIINR